MPSCNSVACASSPSAILTVSLANQEIDSWVRLIRVLTHEIMNTLTPVISLSEALLPQAEGEQHEGLEVIHQTSKT